MRRWRRSVGTMQKPWDIDLTIYEDEAELLVRLAAQRQYGLYLPA